MFDQIEEFMGKLLEKLPEDEQAKVDHQIYYETDKNSLEYMLGVNGTSPHFWMYYDPAKGATADWGAVECWIKKDGTMQGAIFHMPTSNQPRNLTTPVNSTATWPSLSART